MARSLTAYPNAHPSSSRRHGFQIDPRGVRCAERRKNGEGCVHHHQQADIDIGCVNPVGIQQQSCENRNQPAAIYLRDLIGGACTRRAVQRPRRDLEV